MKTYLWKKEEENPIDILKDKIEIIKDSLVADKNEEDCIQELEKRLKKVQELVELYKQLSALEIEEYNRRIEDLEKNKEECEKQIIGYDDDDRRSIELGFDKLKKIMNEQRRNKQLSDSKKKYYNEIIKHLENNILEFQNKIDEMEKTQIYRDFKEGEDPSWEEYQGEEI